MSEPLAERMRPRTLDDYVGQKHLVGEGAVLRKMIDAGRISSFILWGPPGVGKTTLAQIIANKLETPFYTLSAVTSGVKDVREVIERAKSGRFFSSASPILFIDEIHRFSKSQQDSLLGAVERGVVTLIGATTENPSFEVIRPLLSRCQLYVLKSLDKDDLLELLQRAITTDTELSKRHIELKQTDAMLRYSGGARASCSTSSNSWLRPTATTMLSSPMTSWQVVCNRIHWLMTRGAICTTISSRHSSRAFVAATPMPPSTGWHE